MRLNFSFNSDWLVYCPTDFRIYYFVGIQTLSTFTKNQFAHDWLTIENPREENWIASRLWEFNSITRGKTNEMSFLMMHLDCRCWTNTGDLSSSDESFTNFSKSLNFTEKVFAVVLNNLQSWRINFFVNLHNVEGLIFCKSLLKGGAA